MVGALDFAASEIEDAPMIICLASHRAALKGRPPPIGEALAASVLRLRRAVGSDERVAAAFELLEREILGRGIEEGSLK